MVVFLHEDGWPRSDQGRETEVQLTCWKIKPKPEAGALEKHQEEQALAQGQLGAKM